MTQLEEYEELIDGVAAKVRNALRRRESYHRKMERQGVVLFALLIRAAFFRGSRV